MTEYIVKVTEDDSYDGSRNIIEKTELVRCKDCVHHLWCKIEHGPMDPEWFCADGKKDEKTLNRESVIKYLEQECLSLEGLMENNLNNANFPNTKRLLKIYKSAVLLLREQEENVPMKPLCKWLSQYAGPPGIPNSRALYGSLEAAWRAALSKVDWDQFQDGE